MELITTKEYLTKMSDYKRFIKKIKREKVTAIFFWESFMLTYFAIGLSCSILLGFIEAIFLVQLTDDWLGAFIIAGLLEVIKVITIIIRHYISIAKRVIPDLRIPAFTQFVTVLFQFLLFLFSFIALMTVITNYLNQTDNQETVMPLLSMVGNALGVQILLVDFLFLVSLVLCLSLQAAGYIVFANIAAVNASQIEHMFRMRQMEREVKQKISEQRQVNRYSEHRVVEAKRRVLHELDQLKQTGKRQNQRDRFPILIWTLIVLVVLIFAFLISIYL